MKRMVLKTYNLFSDDFPKLLSFSRHGVLITYTRFSRGAFDSNNLTRAEPVPIKITLEGL